MPGSMGGGFLTPGIDEFYQVKAVDKTGLFTRMKRVSISRGFDIQFPVVTDMANKSNATIRCADKTCPFKINLQKNVHNPLEEYRIVDITTLAGQEVPSEQVLDKAKAILDSDAEALVLLE